MRANLKQYQRHMMSVQGTLASSSPVASEGKWLGSLRRLLGVIGRPIPLLIHSAVIILLVAGWYGAWASHESAYDQGRRDALADKSQTDYKRGYDVGLDIGKREASQEGLSSIQAQVQAKVQEAEANLNQQLNIRLQQAYQQGQADYARKIIEHDLQFTSGPKVKEK